MKRATRLSTVAFAAALAFSAACRDDRDDAANDSALARDLTLASAVSDPTPALRDSAEATPPVEQPIVEAPVRRATPPARTPVRERPRPTPPAPAPDPEPVVEAPAPAPLPAPAPAPRIGVIAAGTSVGLSLDNRACSDANRPGDKMVAHTAEAVTGSNGVVFPAGSTVVLEVADVVRGESPDAASVTFRIKSITANDVTHEVTGDVVPTGTLERKRVETKSADQKKVIGGAILGAIVGRVAGGGTKGTVIGAAAGAAAGTAAAAASAKYEACVPAGAPLRLTIGAPINVDL